MNHSFEQFRMYRPVGAREKDVSTRLIKPTLPEINIDHVLYLCHNWDSTWEVDAGIEIYDEGIAQYLLVDAESHAKFFAALILGKPSLRCRLANDEPRDVLDEETDNIFTIICEEGSSHTETDLKQFSGLKNVLSRRGYRFLN